MKIEKISKTSLNKSPIINTRSRLAHLDEVCLIAKETKAACICITETWLDDTVSDQEVHLLSYCKQRNDRNRHGGGVCIFIHEDYLITNGVILFMMNLKLL